MGFRLGISLVLLLTGSPLGAVEAKAKIIALLGSVTVKIRAGAPNEKALRQQEISAGGELRTGAFSFAKMMLPDDSELQVGADSHVILQALSPETVTIVALEQGNARVRTADPTHAAFVGFNLTTPAGSVAMTKVPVQAFLRQADRWLVASLASDQGLLGDQPSRGEVLATPQQIANIGQYPLTISNPEGTRVINAGFSLGKDATGNWNELSRLSTERLLVWQRNSSIVSDELPPLETPQLPPTVITIAEVAQTAASSTSADAGEGTPLQTPAQAIRDFTEISAIAQLKSGEDISTQLLQITTEVHERVVSQQAARVVTPSPLPEDLDPLPREVSISVRYE